MSIEVIKTYDLLHYDSNMHQLYKELKEFVDLRFPNGINFQPHERILFIHRDIDFFVNKDYPGFTLYNLQLILRELDIPNFFCGVVSNLSNFGHFTKLARDLLRPEDSVMRSATSLYHGLIGHLDTYINKDVNLNAEQIEYPFISLNRLSRFPRTFFVAKLFEHMLNDKGLVSYHNIPSSSDTVKITPSKEILQTNFSFLTTAPFIRFNSETPLYQEHNRILVKDFQTNVKKYVNFHEDVDIGSKRSSMMFQNSILEKALVYVGSETVVNYPRAHISKISFKGIADKRPFIILGAPGAIQYIKDLGFRTFNQWWDESYDSETDFETRVDMIIDILNVLSSKSSAELQQMCVDMSDVLAYNFEHFTTNLLAQEKAKIDAMLEIQFL